MADIDHQQFAARMRLADQVPLLPLAFGAGGRHAQLMAPLDRGLVLGGFVIVEQEEGPALVAQVQSLEVVVRSLGDFAATIDLALNDGPTVHTARSSLVARHVVGDLRLIGVLGPDGFDPTVPRAGFAERLHRAATDEETGVVLAALSGGLTSVEVGTIVGSDRVPALLEAKGFSRHTFLCGQSGSGKTYATGVLLERLRLGTELPMIVFDPNSDYVHLGAVSEQGEQDDRADKYHRLADRVLVARARGEGAAGAPMLALHLSDLGLTEQTGILDLDPVDDLDLFAAYRRVVASLVAPYSMRDVVLAAQALGTSAGADLATRIENLGVADWGLWCREGEMSLVERSPFQSACLVLDLGSLTRPEERSLVAAATLQWLWSHRAEKRPVLLVVDEAHNVFPSQPTAGLQQTTTQFGIAIAAEGRKFGLHLLLATQRPSKVHAQVVTQCDNLILLRVNSVLDVEDLCRTFSHVPPGLIRQAPRFEMGELLFAGPIADTPVRARVGRRLSPEGGGDVPTTWAALPST